MTAVFSYRTRGKVPALRQNITVGKLTPVLVNIEHNYFDPPTVSYADTGATIGVDFSLLPTATNATSFGLKEGTELPDGLSLNIATGEIRGTPTTAEAPETIIDAAGKGGVVSSEQFTITVVI